MRVYERVARDGLLGTAAQVKYERQVSGLGLILGGRPEILASLSAIRDSPIIGHGSWARDPKYVLQMNAELQSYGMQPYGFHTGSTALPDLIPEHSHLLGAWMEAGFFGTLFWFWALGLAIAVLSRLYLLRDRMTPLVAYLGLLLVWDILFSPFGAERRLLIPFYLIVLLFTWDRLRGVLRRSRAARQREPEPEPEPEPEAEWEQEL
jgi:O-antigen ligase